MFSVAAKPGTGKVKWVVPSKSFAQRIPRGRVLSTASLASVFFVTGALSIPCSNVPPAAWFDAHGELGGDLHEHAICSTELNTVLSMLWMRRAS